MLRLAAALAATAFSVSASAMVYNISASNTTHDFTLGSMTINGVPYNGLAGNGFTLQNNTAGALTYELTPFDGSTTVDASDFTAALRFGSVGLPGQGWEWNYWVQVGNSGAKQVGFGGGIGNNATLPWNGANGGLASALGAYQQSPSAAFANAPGAYSMVLAAGESAKIFWLDDHFSDNTGGISINVAVVPEPGTWAMFLTGFGVVGWVAARRRLT